MRNKFLAAAVFGCSALALAAAPAGAETKKKHKVWVCPAHSSAHNNRGTVIGAVTGGVLGNVVAGHGSKTGGTLIGAGVGAVAGHQIAKNSDKNCHYVYR